MEKYYKKLMQKNKFANIIDSIVLMFIFFCFTFVFCVIKLRNIYSSIIIGICIVLIAISIKTIIQKKKLKKFIIKTNDEIKKKLIIEKLMISKEIFLKEYTHISKNLYSHKDFVALLLIKYPTYTISANDILSQYNQNCDINQILVTCNVDKECFPLLDRLGVDLKDLNYVIDKFKINIDQKEIEQCINEEIKKRYEKSKQLKPFSKEKSSKYILTGSLLLLAAMFMGRYSILYVSFGVLCGIFSLASYFVSRSQ